MDVMNCSSITVLFPYYRPGGFDCFCLRLLYQILGLEAIVIFVVGTMIKIPNSVVLLRNYLELSQVYHVLYVIFKS